MITKKKRNLMIPALILGICLLFFDLSYAQWSNPIAVTADGQTDINPAMTVALGGRVYVAFQSNRTGTSTPGDNNIWATYWDGTAWSADERVSLTTMEETYPDMTTDSYDRPWVVWYVAGGPYARYHNGTNWSNVMRVHNGMLGGTYPDIAADANGFVYVTWQYHNGFDYNIYCSQFDSASGTWATRQITNVISNEERPQIAIDSLTNNIYLFYMSDRDNNLMPNTQSIYSRTLLTGAGSVANFTGAALSVESRADTNDFPAGRYFDRPTSLIWDNTRNYLYGGWFSSGTMLNGAGQRPIVNDLPGGIPPWTTPAMVLSVGTAGTNSGCSLVLERDTANIWATWTSTRDGNTNIYSNYYDGILWQPADIRVCQNTNIDTVDYYTQASPGTCYDIYGGNGRVWTAWGSNRDGDYNIYVSNNEAPFDLEPPIFENEVPAPFSQNVPLDSPIYIEIKDDAWGPSGDYPPCGVNINSLIMLVEGTTIIDMTRSTNQYDPNYVTIQQLNKFFTYSVTYNPPIPFVEGSEIDVYYYVCDRGDNDTGNILNRNCTAYSYFFFVSEYAWPQFQHDTRHGGISFFPAPYLTAVKWFKQPGGYTGNPVVGVGDRVVFGSSDGFLNVLGANGNIINRYNASSQVTGTPVLGSDGTIYFGTLSGKIMAIDSTDYTLKWQRQTNGPITAPLTITPDGVVIVGSEDGKVYAVESDNNLLWQFQTSSKITAAPACDEQGNVFVATYDGKLFSIYQGTKNWVYTTPTGSYPIETAPTLDRNGNVIFGSWDGNIYAVYSDSGALRDSYNIGTIIISSPAIDRNNNIYFGSGFSVYSLGWNTFTNTLVLRWIYTPVNPSHMGHFNSSPALAYRAVPNGTDSIFIGNNIGVLFQLNIDTGLEFPPWSQFQAGAISTAPAIGRNSVLYVASGSRMYAFGPGTGNNPPVLTTASCTPGTGNTSTQFTYKVNYFDIDQDSPQVAQVIIDGSSFSMTLSSGSASNGTYIYKTTLLPGYNHTYYFSFADGKGGTTILEDPVTSNPFNAPDVGNPQLTLGTAGGACPTLNYSVTYNDQFGADEAKLFVDSISANMTTGNLPPVMNYTASTPAGAAPNDYYCFQFTDIIGNVAYYPTSGGWIDGANCDDLTDPSWASFRGDRLRTGVSDFVTTPGPDVLWMYDVGSPMYSSPVLDNADNTFIGTYSGIFYSIDDSGTLRWTFNTGSDIKSTPSLDSSGNVYFGTQNGIVYAFTNIGVLRWTHQTGGSVYGSPAIKGNNRLYIGSYDSRLYCLSTINGAELWNYQNPNNSPITFSSPCAGPTDIIYVGSIDGTMWAVKDNDTAGILQWTYKTGAAIESTPTVTRQGDLIFGSNDFKIYSLHVFGLEKDTVSGLQIPELNWSYATGNGVASSPAVDSSNMITIGSRDHHLYYLYPSGIKKWDYQVEDFIESSPVIDQNGDVIFGSRDGSVYSLTSGGQPNWIFEDQGDEDTGRKELLHVFTSPALTSQGDVVFGGWNNHILYCLRQDVSTPYFQNATPPDGATGVSIDIDTVSIDILDDFSDIDIDSIVMTLNNETVTPALTKLAYPPYGYKVSLNVIDLFQWGQTALLTVSGCDTAFTPNCNEYQWGFTVEPDITVPVFLSLRPGNGDNVGQNFIIRLSIKDFESGVDDSTIKLFISVPTMPAGNGLWVQVPPSIDPIQDGYYIEYDYPGDYPSGILNIRVDVSDKAIPPNSTSLIYFVNVQLGHTINP